jgi:hypothetical protein
MTTAGPDDPLTTPTEPGPEGIAAAPPDTETAPADASATTRRRPTRLRLAAAAGIALVIVSALGVVTRDVVDK